MDLAQVQRRAGEDFNLVLASLEEVGYGADQAAALWRATDRGGSAYAVKLSGGGTHAGLVVPAHLAASGVTGVPEPVRTRTGRLWSEYDGRRLSVVPWVSDHRALAGGMTAAHWRSFGATLASVHDAAVPPELAAGLPVERHTPATVTRSLHELDRELRERSGPGSPADGQRDELATAVAAQWRAVSAEVAGVTARADRLGRELRGRPSANVICHGDAHIGNLLLGERGRVWLVDWDDVVLAPRERDLMFVLGGVLAFAPVQPEEQAAFFAGYGISPADLDPTRLAYYRCVRVMEDLMWAAMVLDTGRPTTERAEALEIFRGIVSPTGLLRLALA